jgi:hypothetical protein
MRPAVATLLGARDVLPAAVGEEPVIAARDELGPSASVTRYAGLTLDQWARTSVRTKRR